MNIWEKLPKPFFILAPMDDVTDTVFRQIIADSAAPDLFFTEFVNADGLQSPGRRNLLKKLQFSSKEKPIIAQLWGKIPANYETTAREVAKMGYAGIDINMGCPVKVVMKNGCCAALIDDRDLAVAIIQATKKGASSAGKPIPVSVKTRLGVNKIDYSWHELLLEQELAALIIHGRTAKNMSDVPADWDAIGKIRELRDKISPDTKIIGNGDVLSRQQGLELAKRHKLDGIMIGRGIFSNPFVFTGEDAESLWAGFSKEQKIDLYKKHVQLFGKTWPNGERKIHTLNKFCKVYINGFDGAKELRERLMKCDTIEDLTRNLTV